MENDLLFWILAVLSAIFVGLGKGGLPVIALLSVPLLSLIMPTLAAASLLLPVYIVSDMFALYAYRRDFDRDVLKISVTGMTLGILLGWMTAHIVIEWLVTFLIGTLGASFAISLLFGKKLAVTRAARMTDKGGYFWCTIAGFTSFISHSGGPPWQIFVLRLGLSKSAFVGTSVVAFSYCNAIKLIPYYFLGQLTIDSVRLTIYLALPAALAVFTGVKIIQFLPEKLFFKIVSYALLFISLKLIFDGVEVAIRPLLLND